MILFSLLTHFTVSGDIESNVYSLLFVNFSDYRGEIIEAIKRADKQLEAGDLPSFKAMRTRYLNCFMERHRK